MSVVSVKTKAGAGSAENEAELLERRAAIEAELERLRKGVDRGRREAEAEIASCDREKSEIDRSEMEAWGQWAKDAGPEPPAHGPERAAITKRRVLAERDLASAQLANDAVHKRREELGGELRQLSSKIFEILVERAVADALRHEQDMRAAEAAFVAAAVKIEGIRAALFGARVEAMGAANQVRVAVLTPAIDRVQAIPPGSFTGDTNELARLAAAAKRRLTG